ncbi:alpha/beta fold hydrolase [Actinokineospora iranica]|uniref:Pimeloyl-ACP methyl ester carboxylesterase n=1 Tax=Actinokineospora iranica TaxID=1271860 RepID=A0A1G6W8N2_9PSEU|nr:alpha/beta fold hydrolase [Actinokineospora iranica]SDD61587.1 Pimeloyl-ACP methyl ester carboxylesterase [Actinokineospora iranica]
MTRTVLITGSAVLTGAHLAARRLSASADYVVFAPWGADQPSGADLVAAVRRVLRSTVSGAADVGRMRCLSYGEGLARALPEGWRIEEVWCLTGTPWVGGEQVAAADLVGTRRLLEELGPLGVRELNQVGSVYAAGLDAGHVAETPWAADDGLGDEVSAQYTAMEREVVSACAAAGVAHRTFRTGLVVGESLGLAGVPREGAAPLFGTLHDLVREVRERLPEYFGHQPLRWHARAGGSLGLIEVGEAAEALLCLGYSEQAGGVHHVVAPSNLTVEKLIDQIGEAYDIPIAAVADRDELTAVDRLFAARLGAFTGFLSARTTFDHADRCGPESQVNPDLLRLLRRGQDLAARAAARRVAETRMGVRRRTIDAHGAPLTYEVAGSDGPVLVILNALGQGTGFWYRLVDRLADRYRVILWEPRGTDSPVSVLLPDQVNDLVEVLRHERADTCDLLGWCTGPKVAVEFARRRPSAVRSMVLLNGSFRAGGRVGDPDTPYERNLEALCRMVGGQPHLAKSMLRMFGLQEEFDPADEADPHRLAERVLSLANRTLAEDLRRPFRSPATLVNYARQLLDFWAHDSLAEAGSVTTPMLFVGAEFDTVASPERFRQSAAAFPNARHVQIDGATHYVMHDRPDLVAALVDGFLRGHPLGDLAGLRWSDLLEVR